MMSVSDKSLQPMAIIPAGAGSGKTYTVQQRLGEWVEEGLIDPQRIVAVTFTEAAASELRERIRARLLEIGRLDDALKLDQAYISTIHGFGLKILTEFAFDAGSSPQPRLLNEDEQSALIRQSLAHTSRVKEITYDLAAYGYRYTFGSNKSAEDVFRDDVLAVITLLRSMGWKQGDKNASDYASEWIKKCYGVTLKGSTLTNTLHKSVLALLKAFPESLVAEYGNNKTAINAFNSDFRNLKKSSSLHVLKKDWKLWDKLRGLRLSVRGCKLPDEYETLAQHVIDAADQLPFHPGPLQHSIGHIEALIAASQEVLLHYSEAKREAGLVDYADMIAMAHDLLANNSSVLNTLTNRIDCLVVDEFQDTNPLQFSLLWLLKEAGIPTLIVGDLKQAIMGFQGADARLFEALEDQYPESNEPLTQNWRSQPKLMDFVNAVGPVLFEEAYTSLTPKALESELSALEVFNFPKKAKKGQHLVRAGHVGKRIKKILDAGDQFIIDRRTSNRRVLQGGDIAVLAPTRNMLLQYAEVFRALGLKVRLKEEGWAESREIQIALHALAYVANPADRHGALYLAVTELGELSLQNALTQIMSSGVIQDPILNKLDVLSETVTERTIYALVVDTLQHLGIYDVISLWPNAQQARANLLRLQSESVEYMDANREALSNGGIYGSGIKSFLAWLTTKAEDNDLQPASKVIDEDAIELVTWHSSKGREWPLVAVAGLDRDIKARLPDLGLGYQSFDDLSKLLLNTQIEYSPLFAAKETNEKFLEILQKNADKEARRLLYVALTRARDKLLIEWPSYLEGKPGSYWSLLADNQAVSLGKDCIKINDEDHPCKINKGSELLPTEVDLEADAKITNLPTTGRRAISSGVVTKPLTPDSVSPSMLNTEENKIDLRGGLSREKYAEEMELKSELPANKLGTAVHKIFEILGCKPDLAVDVLNRAVYGVEQDMIFETSQQVKLFEKWVQKRFSPKSTYRELPFISINDSGSVVSGSVDLVIENEHGIVIIDHKTDQVDDPIDSFSHYLPQLMSYADELSKEMGKVVSVGIHWVRKGEVVFHGINNV